MAIPTYQDLSTIIKMWRDLEKAKSTFWKNKAKRTKSAHGKNLDDLSVDELLEKLGYTCDPDKPKSLHGLLGAVVRSAVKGEGIPTQFTPKKGKPLSLEDYVGGVKVYFIKGIPAFTTSVLQGLLEQVITPLYKDEEIHTIDEQGKLTEERKNLDEIRDAVRFELKRRTERKRNEKKQENLIGELATNITEINILRNGWPKKIQDQIDKIDVLLSPYWDYLKANGFWGENERRIIEAALKSTESKKPKYSPNVIQELEKVRYNIQIGSNQKSESQVTAGQGKKAVDNWHNADFTEVCWNGKRYKFDKSQQALSVGYLWNNKRAREKSIGEAIGSEADNFRLIHIFRQSGKKAKMHPAWGAMIVADGKGIYALAESKKVPKK